MLLALPLLFVTSFCTPKSPVIELNTNLFRKEVLGGDNVYFVMFSMTTCEPCDQMMPQFERLAKKMRAIGIKVGKINVENNQEIARTYNIEQVPKLLLFRPNKEPLEYSRDRTSRAMEKFITDNQPGLKQVAVLSDEDKIENFFNSTSRVPRLLLFSSRTSIPPVYKQICYTHRRGLICGFVSETHETVKEIAEQVAEIGEFNFEELEYPTIYSIDRRRTPVLHKYTEQQNFESINEYLRNISLVKPKEDEEAKKEAARQKRAEERKARKEKDRLMREQKEAERAKRGKGKAKRQDDDDEDDAVQEKGKKKRMSRMGGAASRAGARKREAERLKEEI